MALQNYAEWLWNIYIFIRLFKLKFIEWLLLQFIEYWLGGYELYLFIKQYINGYDPYSRIKNICGNDIFIKPRHGGSADFRKAVYRLKITGTHFAEVFRNIERPVYFSYGHQNGDYSAEMIIFPYKQIYRVYNTNNPLGENMEVMFGHFEFI